ncbi:hypothetical protein BDB01DRAFT_805673 [Pilobolus umbonatus]|nr:hypothetical protein BDB01DRAFT_805673 [Pilobolus umbonatus]
MNNISYRTFLREGYKAVKGNTHNQRKEIRLLIREGFRKHADVQDPEEKQKLMLKAKNTLELLTIASERRGIAHDIVRNLCYLKYFRDKYNERPPMFNRKMNADTRNEFKDAYTELDCMKDMLNKDLDLCL